MSLVSFFIFFLFFFIVQANNGGLLCVQNCYLTEIAGRGCGRLLVLYLTPPGYIQCLGQIIILQTVTHLLHMITLPSLHSSIFLINHILSHLLRILTLNFDFSFFSIIIVS